MMCTGYQIEKIPVHGRGAWTPVTALPVNGTSFTVPNLVEGSEWEFRVAAVNDAGPGKYSKSTGPHKVRDPVCKCQVLQVYAFTIEMVNGCYYNVVTFACNFSSIKL